MRVDLTPLAERDLEAIGDYIAQDDPLRTVTFVEELRQATEVLATFPSAFPVVPGYEEYQVRVHTHGHYAVYYRVFTGDARVVVLRVPNTAQDRQRALAP